MKPTYLLMGTSMTDEEFIKQWQATYEEFVNDPASDCPSCGVQLMVRHKEGCAEYERIKQEAKTATGKDDESSAP